MSATGDPVEAPDLEACTEVLGTRGLENSRLYKSHLVPLHESTLWVSQPHGLTDPAHQRHPQFCGERRWCIKERNKDNKSLCVSTGWVLSPMNY